MEIIEMRMSIRTNASKLLFFGYVNDHSGYVHLACLFYRVSSVLALSLTAHA